MIYQIFTKNHEVPAQKKHLPHKNQTQNWRDLGSQKKLPFRGFKSMPFQTLQTPGAHSSFSHIHSPLLICIACAKNLSSMVTSNSCLDEKGCFHVFFGSIPQAISIWLVSPRGATSTATWPHSPVPDTRPCRRTCGTIPRDGKPKVFTVDDGGWARLEVAVVCVK